LSNSAQSLGKKLALRAYIGYWPEGRYFGLRSISLMDRLVKRVLSIKMV
jgi:hypothetical protein